MAHIHVPSRIPVRYLERSTSMTTLFGGMFVVGLAAFLYTLGQDPDRAWQAYVSNWLFFTSIAMGAVAFTATTVIVKARWNWSVRRVSLSFVAFLPISFILLLPMLGLGEDYFPWIGMMADDPIVQKKAAYLNMPFLTARNVVGTLLLFGLSIYFAYLALRPDMGLTEKETRGDEGRSGWIARLTQGWKGQEVEEVRSYQRLNRLAPALIIIYAVVMSIISYDWVMSLEPHWYSTMMGPWFFMGAFLGGITVTAFTTTILKNRDKELNRAMGTQQLWDLGKLSFAFSVFWTYLFFAQYLVIWYGKLPWEQAWIIHRSEDPWGPLSLLVIVLLFVIPFAGLIGRKAKMAPQWLWTMTLVILSGLWLEKYMMVAPSIRDRDTPIFGVQELLIGLMFLGLFVLAVRWFLSTFPIVQLWKPMEQPEMFEAEVAHPAEVR
jgi:hypothetical protein